MIIQNVTVRDVKSPYHNKTVDIKIADGVISKVSVNEGQSSNQIVTPGLVDLSSDFCDPGNEHKEDLYSGMQAAELGGFTDICLQPNTKPSLDSKGSITYIKNKTSGSLVSLWPYGSLSVGNKGEAMSEMLDLHEAGAVAISDGDIPIVNSELLLKALQYTAKFDGLVVNRPLDPNLSAYAQMHEGIVSTQLGMKGFPAISEQLTVQRDLSILDYAGGKLRFSAISCAESVALIRDAKQKGLSVTCDVPLHNLIYTDEELTGFDTNRKVNPPLRSEEHRKALIGGVVDGTIDAISIDHRPHDEECKNLEFDLADFGTIGLQTAFSELLKLTDELDFDLLISKLTHGPREVMGLDPITIDVGQKAKLSVFDTEVEWKYDHSANASKSSNSPLFGQVLKGRSVGIVNGSKSNF